MTKKSRSYGIGSPFKDVFPVPVISTRAPTTSDLNYELGQVWVRTGVGAYILTQVASGSATWASTTPAASDVDTLTGDGGGAISPAVGNITLAGGTNITTAGAGSTITFNMDAAITLATSVTSPIYTSAAAMAINAPAGNDITVKMGDGIGANKVSFVDSASAEVFSIDSDGDYAGRTMSCTAGTASTSLSAPLYTTAAGVDLDITVATGQDAVLKLGDAAGANYLIITDSADASRVTIDSDGAIVCVNVDGIVGAVTPAAGSFTTVVAGTAYTTTAATDLNINSIAGQDIIIKMGDAAAANKISFVDSGSVEVASLDSDGGLTVVAFTFSGLLTASASATIETAGTALNLGSDNSGDAVNLGVGTAARAIGIGNSAAAHTITIGSTTGAASLTLQAGTGSLALASTGTGDITIDSDDTLLLDADGVLELNSSSDAINIGNDADAQAINIGTGAAARTITVGNGTGATSLVFDCGTGALNIGTNAIAHTTTIGNGTGASSVVIDCGTGALNIGTNAIAHTVTIGNVTGATAVAVNAGTGGIALASTGTGDITIDSNDTLLLDADGVLELNSSAGVISIGNDADAQNINIGTGAAARTITVGNVTGATSVVVDCGTGALNLGTSATAHTTTVGSTTGASALVLQGGTGDITVTGTVKQLDSEFMTASGDDITFSMSPATCTAANTGGVATGATGDVNILSCEQGFMMEQFILGAGQTIIKPVMDANGLLISLDLTATEGAEYNLGAARTNSRSAFTIGTDAAFFLEVELYVADLSGGNPYVIGFRKSEANNATIANYSDYACLGMNSVTSATNVTILTELNGGGQTATDTTDAWGGDASTQKLTVKVSAAGVTTFEVGGVAATAAPAFTFDNADVVVPFIHLLHGAAAPGAVNLVSWKCGYQA